MDSYSNITISPKKQNKSDIPLQQIMLNATPYQKQKLQAWQMSESKQIRDKKFKRYRQEGRIFSQTAITSSTQEESPILALSQFEVKIQRTNSSP